MIRAIFLLALSAAMGIALTEGTIQSGAVRRVNARVLHAAALLQSFRSAQGDDARQLALMRAGWVTLKFSLQLLFILISALLISLMPVFALHWSSKQATIYFTAMSVSAIAWWLVRTRPVTHAPKH